MTRIEDLATHKRSWRRRLLGAILVLALLLLLLVACWSWRTYRHLSSFRAHLIELKSFSPSDVSALGRTISQLQEDLTLIRRDLALPLSVAPHLKWLPTVGPTIQAGPSLFSAGYSLLTAGATVWDVVHEPIEAALAGELGPEETVLKLSEGIVAGEDRLQRAARQVREACDLINSINANQLVPQLSGRLAQMQPLTPLLTAAVDALPHLPKLLIQPGEQTYLLLAQNNDELRPTGGFISSVGTLTISQGVPRFVRFEDGWYVENWNQPHPDPPESLRKHMKLDLWMTRDANWWPDFPTSARAVAELYELNQGQPVTGMVGIDVEAAVRLLDVLTPLKLPDGRLVKGGQVVEAFRESWSLAPESFVTSHVVVTATRPFTSVEIALTYSKKKKGTVWFDSVMLESLEQPGINLVHNPSFEDDTDRDGLPDEWEAVGLADGDGLVIDLAHTGTASLRIAGNPEVSKAVVQRVAVSGEAGTAFRVSAMSQGKGLELRGGSYALIVTFLHRDGKRESRTIKFPSLAHEWASAGTTEVQADWLAHRKDFVDEIMRAAMAKVLAKPSDVPWLDLLAVFRALLDERHIQIYVEEPSVQEVLRRHGWAGALAEGDGDYLLVVDSNVGYNKVTASMEQSLGYDVEIALSGRVRSWLTLTYHNRSTVALAECDKFSQYVANYAKLTQGCYWDYVRIYLPLGSEIQSATGGDEPVDVFSELGRTVFATSLIVRPGERRELEFAYLLPRGTLRDGTYELYVQKQAGTKAIPLHLAVSATKGLTPQSHNPVPRAVSYNRVTYATDLLVDRSIAVQITP